MKNSNAEAKPNICPALDPLRAVEIVQQFEQLAAAPVTEARTYLLFHAAMSDLHFSHKFDSFLRQMESEGAPVIFNPSPLHKVEFFKARDQRHEISFLDAVRLDDLGLLESWIGADQHQNCILRWPDIETRENGADLLSSRLIRSPHGKAQAFVQTRLR
jgi:hypothetical protein